MGVLMSVAFAIPTYYFCELQGSFFVVWLVWLVSLADGIGERPAEHNIHDLFCSLDAQCCNMNAEQAFLT